MAYQIAETANFERAFKKSVSQYEYRIIRERLAKHVYPQLRQEPHFGPNIKKLRDVDPPTYRYRIGHFRLFYVIDEPAHIVIIAAVRQRKEAYR